jgi:hypothetical protein
MECSEALDLLFASFDAQITPTQQSLLDAHRRTCFACANSMARAERFQSLLHQVPQLTVPRGLEQRIVNRVLAIHGVPVHKTESRTLIESLTNWRTYVASFAMAAAAFALIIIARGAIDRVAVSHRPVDETVTAYLQGQVQDESANQTTQQSENSMPISTGDTVRNTSSQPAVVAITPHLAVTLASDSVVEFNKLHMDQRTGDPDIIDMKVAHGTVAVREQLHRGVPPIHVATNQATMLPTGTQFSVTADQGATKLAVSEGSVAVFVPGETFNVIAGQSARITAKGHDVTGKPHKTWKPATGKTWNPETGKTWGNSSDKNR